MRKVISLLCSLTLILGSLSACKNVEPEIANYREQTKQLRSISFAELQSEIKNDESSIVYIGRENCPFCVKLVPELLSLQDKFKIKFSYFDVIKTNDEIDKFFDDNKLEYVPSLLCVGHGKVTNIPLDYNYVKTHGTYNVEEIMREIDNNILLTGSATTSKK